MPFETRCLNVVPKRAFDAVVFIEQATPSPPRTAD